MRSQERAATPWRKRLYMDDECLRVRRNCWKTVLTAIQAGLAEHGYKLRLDKTRAHCPAATCNAELASELRAELEGYATYEHAGLSLLGKATDGTQDTVITSSGPMRGPLQKRMDAARRFAQRLHALLDADMDGKKLGPAWKLITLVLNRTLSYDLCVSPPGDVLPHAVELDGMVAALARKCADRNGSCANEIWTQALDRARQPRQNGGLDLHSVADLAPYAFLSTVVSVLPDAAAKLCAPDGQRMSTERAYGKLEETGIIAHAEAALQRIQADGVIIDSWAMPRSVEMGQQHSSLDFRTLITAGINMCHRRRSWLQARAEAAEARLPPSEKAHRWTHGGDEGGLGFSANLTNELCTWDDEEFNINLCRRLRLPVCVRGEPCQHTRKRTAGKAAGSRGPAQVAQQQTQCSAPLDEWGDHAVQCMVGGAHTAVHDAITDEIAKAQLAAGLHARREVYVPQLATPKKTEPRADLHAWGLAALPQTRLDFTLVSPWASRHLGNARSAPAQVAAKAEQAKDKEYGAAGGICILGLAMEAGGRHGPRLQSHLKLLASLARSRDGLAGREPRRHLHAWRQRIAVLLGRFTAYAVISAQAPPCTDPRDCKPISAASEAHACASISNSADAHRPEMLFLHPQRRR